MNQDNSNLDLKTILHRGLHCKCPRCGVDSIYEKKWTSYVRDHCPECKLDLSDNDSADGPAYILICILGTFIVPAALVFELFVSPPLWVHAVLWTIVCVAITLLSLRPLRSIVISLLYKADPDRWSDFDKT